MKHLLALLLPVCLLISGCGYHLGAQKPARLAHVQRLAIPTAENLTLEPRLGVLVTNAIIKHVQNHGSYEISTRDRADAVLVASIRNIYRSQFRSDRTNILRSSQLLMGLEISYRIEDPSGKVLHTNYANGESYVILDPNLQLSETQALEDAAQRAAINLANDISEGW
ncbi:MAG: hypothetical protein HS117_11825 [Verrucomicrobiaceae bacterium]|nr:hypothetical protein [Verrucomicrobiaceae bacterium]